LEKIIPFVRSTKNYHVYKLDVTGEMIATIYVGKTAIEEPNDHPVEVNRGVGGETMGHESRSPYYMMRVKQGDPMIVTPKLGIRCGEKFITLRRESGGIPVFSRRDIRGRLGDTRVYKEIFESLWTLLDLETEYIIITDVPREMTYESYKGFTEAWRDWKNYPDKQFEQKLCLVLKTNTPEVKP